MRIEIDAFFSALAHTVRLRALMLLLRERELCVCELTYALDLSQPMISRHLAQLREAGVVLDRREGLWIHYRLHPQLPAWARGVLEEAARGAARTQPYATDYKNLKKMPDRPGQRCA